MKKLSLLFAFPFLCLILFPSMSHALGFDGIGAKVAFVLPEDPMDNALGFGVLACLGPLFPQLTALKAEASVDYWGNSYDTFGSEVNFTSVGVNGTLKYYFSSGGITPFAGAGIGLIYSRSSFEVSIPGFTGASSSDTDLGLHLCGGVDIPIGPGVKITAEGRYVTGGVDNIQIIGAFVIKLK
jgi:hypothetical protein